MSRFLLCAVVVVAAFSGVLADPGVAAPAAPAHVLPEVVITAPRINNNNAAAKFIGRACHVKNVKGVCQTSTCEGQSVAGFCEGPSTVKCCVPHGTAPPATPPATPTPGAVTPATPSTPNIPNVGDQGAAVKPNPAPASGGKLMPNGKPAPTGTPAAFPWTFPYSQARHIVSDFNLQRIRLYDGANMVKEWKMSSGKYGIGFKSSIPATPCGKFNVVMKVGTGQPLGEIIEKLTPQHRIGKQADAFAHMQTRILVLDGVDKNAHYDNTNTRSRSIYIHGTNKEKELGTMQSHGCFRMGNAEVIELFDLVQTGVEYFAVPFNAWP